MFVRTAWCGYGQFHKKQLLQLFELFTYILSMVTLKSGIILDQNEDGPLKWANGPYPIQIHVDNIILMGFLNFYGPSANVDGPKNP